MSPVRRLQNWTGEIGIAENQLGMVNRKLYPKYILDEVNCILLQAERSQIIQTWTIKVGGARLSLDDYNQKIGCLTALNRTWNITLKVLHWETSMDCRHLISAAEWISNIDNTGLNRSLLTNTLTPDGRETCPYQVPSKRHSFVDYCAGLPYSLFSGLVRCESDAPVRQSIRFTSLNFLKRWHCFIYVFSFV